MAAKITILGKEHDVSSGTTICDAVRSIGHMPDAFIFIVNGRPVPMDSAITEGMVIKAVKVASGG
ncbi:MAG: MoaD/ThiS family protein [Methanomassiliicoccaceae archaeon]|nr:MoaD/ThiS family protein [Methanomassiliicoccaceae archaeon]